jgi:hypothetical protein
MMNLEEFKAEFLLALTKKEGEISLVDATLSHQDDPPEERVFFRVKCDGKTFCPITFLYYTKKRKYISMVKYYEAGMEIGLNSDEVFTIVHSADETFEAPSYSQEIRDHFMSYVR